MPSSYNGWPASPDKAAIGVVQFGDAAGFPFPGGVKGGDVATVLGYVATQLHYRVEPCVNGWTWGYTYKANVNNPSQLSCHASGTAIDWNAPDHPNGSSGTFTDAQVGVIYTILDEVQGVVSWLEGYDEMHFEICTDAASVARVAASLPGGGTPPPPADDDWLSDMSDEQYSELIGTLGETNRLLRVLAGYPGGNEVEASVGVQVRGAGVGETVRLLGVLAGNPGNPGSLEASVGVQVRGAMRGVNDDGGQLVYTAADVDDA